MRNLFEYQNIYLHSHTVITFISKCSGIPMSIKQRPQIQVKLHFFKIIHSTAIQVCSSNQINK